MEGAFMAENRERINLTILHSNDIHGDFVPEEKNGVLSGGIARLAGYINQTRAKEKNVIYAVAGDMFKGSIIDSEYMGISTIELMNMLAPDVVTLGNHEIDYGLAHLLFIEPPSFEELERRLRGRGTEDEAMIRQRLDAAKVELSRKEEYDVCFVNDEFEKAVSELVVYVNEAANGK